MYTNVYPGVSRNAGCQTIGEKEGVCADVILATIPLPLQIHKCFVEIQVTVSGYSPSIQEVDGL